MNYENFDRITEKVEKIQELQKTLDRLQTHGVQVVLTEKDIYNRTLAISTSPESEHEYQVEARKFLTDIIVSYINKINELKDELKEL